MAPRFALTAVAALLFVVTAVARGNADVSKPPHARHANCGPALASPPYTDPPVVVVSQLPIDASGNHELRLAVHRDDDRFCYRYKLNGAVQTVAPTIRVHRGEAFDVRIINDISGPSKGESIASDALPPCLPMAMPASRRRSIRRLPQPPGRGPVDAAKPARRQRPLPRVPGARRSGKHLLVDAQHAGCTRASITSSFRVRNRQERISIIRTSTALRAIRSQAASRVRGSSSRTLRRLRRLPSTSLPCATAGRSATTTCLHPTSRRLTLRLRRIKPH